MNYTPYDWMSPNWRQERIIHDWKNYISDEIRLIWGTLSVDMKMMLARQADEIADREQWD